MVAGPFLLPRGENRPTGVAGQMTLATIPDHRLVRQGQLVLAPAAGDNAGQPGERSRPPLDADTTCHPVTGPITPAAPNRALTAAVAAPTAATRSCHGDPHAVGTTRSTPANRAATQEMRPHRFQSSSHPPQPATDR
jgi:hypothetical protein